MGLLGRRSRSAERKRASNVVPPYAWGEPLSRPADPRENLDSVVEESGDWFWLGATLEPGEERRGRCKVFIYQAKAEGLLFLTNHAFYLGYARTAKRYPLADVQMFAVDPADYGEVTLAVRFGEVGMTVPTHLRILDPTVFSRFYPTAVQLITTTRSPAVLNHESVGAQRADVVRELHEALVTYLRPGETTLAESWVAATSAQGADRAEYWVVTNKHWMRLIGNDMLRLARSDGMVAKAEGAGQDRYEFLIRRNGQWGRTASIAPLMSPLTGPDDRWWEFFDLLVQWSWSSPR
jgi:hypothetical protein